MSAEIAERASGLLGPRENRVTHVHRDVEVLNSIGGEFCPLRGRSFSKGPDEFAAAVREWDESKKGGASQFRPREYPLCDIAMLNDIGHRGTKGNGFSPRPMQRGF
jgi:hypothetical protein